MNRRNFEKKLAALAMINPLTWIKQQDMIIKEKKYPKPLVKNEVIGLIAPAGYITQERLARAIDNVYSLGYQVKYLSNIAARKKGYLAGSEQERIDEIHAMFNDPDVKAIWCIRGGFGLAHILDRLDYNMIENNPKIIIGYSDITALLIAINLRTGLVCFHGPVAGVELNDYNTQVIKNILSLPDKINYNYQSQTKKFVNENYTYSILKHGIRKGELIGGNLTILASLVGTAFSPSYRNKIVFMEDVDERPYRIDRMLTQLIKATDISSCAGIIFGIFDGCVPNPDEESFSLLEVLRDKFADLDIPIIYGYTFGHVKHCCAMPIGSTITLDTSLGLDAVQRSAE